MSLKLSKSLFFFLFIFTPLAFGTTEPWSYAIMEILVTLAVLLFFISILKNNEPFHATPGITPLIIFLSYILFQLIPLPPFILEFLSPNAFKIHEANNYLSDTDSWMSITVNPKSTLSEFFRYSTYVLFYILTVQLLKKKETLQTTVIVIAIFGGLLAFSSILQFYTTQDMVLWFRHVPRNALATGPYVNHNHYAGLMELMFPVVLGLFLFYRPRIGNTSLIKGIAEIFSQEKANIHILIGTSALLIVVSIFVSLSRGAMISTCLSLVIFTYFLLKRKISKGNTTLIISVTMLSALCIGWFGWDQILNRFASLKNAQGIIYEYRLDFWKDSQNIIANYKLTGSGMGTFSHIYPLHRSLKSESFLAHAHNDYLELLVEGGIISFSVAALFLLTLFYKTYKVFAKRRDAFSIYIYIGSITAMVSILFHSFTDFNMHVGANGLWFFFIAGIAVSAANTGMRKHSSPTRLIEVESTARKRCSGMIVCILFLAALVYNISNLMGLFYYSNIKNYDISSETPPEFIKKIEKVADFATRFDPLRAEYIFLKANTAWFLNDLERSRAHFIESIRLDPLNSRRLNHFATFLGKQGESDKAQIAFKNSMTYDRSSAEYTFQYGAWLFAKNDFQEGISYMKKTLTLDDTFIDRVLTTMIVAGVSAYQMEDAIPDLPGPSIAFAQFLYDTGNVEEAVDRHLDALDLIEGQKFKPSLHVTQQLKTTKKLFYKVYHFFKKHNDLKNAMQIMERAEKKLPMDASIKVTLGDLYYDQNISYKALEKYDHALLIDPANKRALKMIRKINR